MKDTNTGLVEIQQDYLKKIILPVFQFYLYVYFLQCILYSGAFLIYIIFFDKLRKFKIFIYSFFEQASS
jgi:hypothetical protein